MPATIRDAAGVSRSLFIPVTVALVACVLFAQWLAVFAVVPHAPLHECQQHRCGCPAEMTARKACCCFSHESKTATLISSAHCDGDEGGPTITLEKLQWSFVRADELSHVVGPATQVEPVAVKSECRSHQPLVPPPKFLLDV